MPTPSEEWFDEYLADNAYRFQVEPDLGVRTRPDRLIERAGLEAICEIKEFTTDALMRRWPEGGSQVGAFSSDEWLRNVRRAISDAARQLEPLAGDARPLVIVLANPHGVLAEITGDKLIEAMYGDLGVRIAIDTEIGGPASEPQWVLGAGGRLADERAPWVSAVIGLHRGNRQRDWELQWVEDWKHRNWPEGPSSTDDALARWEAYQADLEEALQREEVPTGDYLYLHVVETVSDEAVALPRCFFDAELDRRWAINRNTGAVEELP